MGSISLSNSLPITRVSVVTSSSLNQCIFQCPLLHGRLRSASHNNKKSPLIAFASSGSGAAPAGVNFSSPAKSGTYRVGDFMTRKENLHVVKPTTSVDDALEILVEKKISGLPVVDDDWNLVGVVSDYDLLALDSISATYSLKHLYVESTLGGSQSDTNMFPNVNSSWKTFNELQKLISKTYGRVIGDLMTPSPLVVRETTNLEEAAKLLLETKYRRLPVVDADGKLVGILTRGNVVSAALKIKRENEKSA